MAVCRLQKLVISAVQYNCVALVNAFIPETNELFYVNLWLTCVIALTGRVSSAFTETHDIEDAVFLVDSTSCQRHTFSPQVPSSIRNTLKSDRCRTYH